LSVVVYSGDTWNDNIFAEGGGVVKNRKVVAVGGSGWWRWVVGRKVVEGLVEGIGMW